MATLHIKNVPDRLYQRAQKLAETQGQSLSSYIIWLMQTALEEEQTRRRQAELLQAIRRDRWTPPPGAPSIDELLHEARQERGS